MSKFYPSLNTSYLNYPSLNTSYLNHPSFNTSYLLLQWPYFSSNELHGVLVQVQVQDQVQVQALQVKSKEYSSYKQLKPGFSNKEF